MPEARQNNSKLAEIFDRASSFSALVGIAVDVVSLFMALLSFLCGTTTPSLAAQGEQRRFSYFNIERDNFFDQPRASLVSVRKHFESFESFVIQSGDLIREGHHRCGRRRTADVTTAANCDIRVT
jgi:hypothetical protein